MKIPLWPLIRVSTHNRVVSELLRSIDRKNGEIASLRAVARRVERPKMTQEDMRKWQRKWLKDGPITKIAPLPTGPYAEFEVMHKRALFPPVKRLPGARASLASEADLGLWHESKYNRQEGGFSEFQAHWPRTGAENSCGEWRRK